MFTNLAAAPPDLGAPVAPSAMMKLLAAKARVPWILRNVLFVAERIRGRMSWTDILYVGGWDMMEDVVDGNEF